MNKSALNKELIEELFGNNKNIKEITVEASQIKEEISKPVLNEILMTELFRKEPVKEKGSLNFFSYRQEIKEDEGEEVKPIDKLKKFVKGFMPGFAKTTIMKFDKINGDIKKIRDYFEDQRAEQAQYKDDVQYGLFYRYYDGIIKEIERVTI